MALSKAAVDWEPPDLDMNAIYQRLDDMRPDNIDISSHFSAEELQTMPEIEQNRYKSIKLNYLVMLEFGVPAHLPEFMNKKRMQKFATPPPSDSGDDEEWKPRKRKNKQWRAPSRKMSKMSKDLNKRTCEKTEGQNNERNNSALQQGLETDFTSHRLNPYEEFSGFSPTHQKKQIIYAQSRIKRIGEVISKFETNKINMREVEGLEPTANWENLRVCNARRTLHILGRDQHNEMRKTAKGGNTKPISELCLTPPGSDTSCNEDSRGQENFDLLKYQRKVELEIDSDGRYPKRQLTDVNYKDVEVPEDDEFIWCEDCQAEYQGDCPQCGPLLIIEDNLVTDSDSQYAIKSIPDILYTSNSRIAGAGIGVFSRTVIKKGVRFGPYLGLCVVNEDEAHKSGYSWEIQRGGKTSHFVDARSSTVSNWMRYVNCARNGIEQNLLAFQYCGNIYYRTLRVVQPGEELLVWYGDSYGIELGLVSEDSMEKYWNQDIQGFQCDQSDCDSAYSSSDRLIVHLALKHHIIVNTIWFHCPHCRLTYRTQTKLNDHLLYCKYKKESSCDLVNCVKIKEIKCHSDCESVENSSLGTISRDKYKCNNENVCDNSRYTHKCTVCGKGFTNRRDLETHNRVHTGERPYKCDQCGKAFSVKSSLNTHMRTHTGEKPFKCSQCGEAFSQKGNLNTHMRTHTGEKPFKCSQCGEAFSRKGDLNTHMRTHTGEKPFKCSQCGKAFSQKPNLNTHMKKH